MRQRTDIAIVGAATAGLAAARECQALGIEDMRILEGRGRLGGRIKTDAFTHIEDGAELLHTDTLLPLIHSLGLDVQAYDETRGVYLHTEENPELSRDTPGTGSIADIISRIQMIIRSNRLPSVSVTDFLTSGGLLYRKNPQVGKLASMHRDLILTALQAEYGADPSLLSIRSLQEASALDNKNYRIVGGFTQLPERMAVDLPINYHQPVERIRWSPGKVELFTPDAILEARRAIVTVPIGLLQNNRPAFEPPLPEHITNAIESIGNATVCKLIIMFSQRVWPEDLTLLRTDIGEAPLLWPNASEVPSLTCFVGGRPALRLQKQEESVVIRNCIAHLSKIFGRDMASIVTTIRRVAWGRKEFSHTGYSFIPIRSMNEREILARPIEGTLAFAGEACASTLHPHTASTVCGAYLSGIQAARKLLSA